MKPLERSGFALRGPGFPALLRRGAPFFTHPAFRFGKTYFFAVFVVYITVWKTSWKM